MSLWARGLFSSTKLVSDTVLPALRRTMQSSALTYPYTSSQQLSQAERDALRSLAHEQSDWYSQGERLYESYLGGCFNREEYLAFMPRIRWLDTTKLNDTSYAELMRIFIDANINLDRLKKSELNQDPGEVNDIYGLGTHQEKKFHELYRRLKDDSQSKVSDNEIRECLYKPMESFESIISRVKSNPNYIFEHPLKHNKQSSVNYDKTHRQTDRPIEASQDALMIKMKSYEDFIFQHLLEHNCLLHAIRKVQPDYMKISAESNKTKTEDTFRGLIQRAEAQGDIVQRTRIMCDYLRYANLLPTCHYLAKSAADVDAFIHDKGLRQLCIALMDSVIHAGAYAVLMANCGLNAQDCIRYQQAIISSPELATEVDEHGIFSVIQTQHFALTESSCHVNRII